MGAKCLRVSFTARVDDDDRTRTLVQNAINRHSRVRYHLQSTDILCQHLYPHNSTSELSPYRIQAAVPLHDRLD